MGNCSPLPCPSPCPDLSFQEICANNNCHSCCIFHCSKQPSEPAQAPAWDDSPLAQTRQLPHLPPSRPGTARGGIGGVVQDDVPSYGGYRFQPSPWGTESGSVATMAKERHSGSRVAPPGVPRNGDRPVPSLPLLAWPGLAESCAAASHDDGGVPRHADHLATPPLPLSRRTDRQSAGSSVDDGWGVARNHDQPLQSPWRAETWTTSAPYSGAAAADDMPAVAPRPGLTGATGRDDDGSSSRVVRNKPGQPVQSPRRALSDCSVETWAISRDAGAAAADTRACRGGIISAQGSSSPPAPPLTASRSRETQQGRFPSSSLSAADRLSPAVPPRASTGQKARPKLETCS
ncbi:unnamed protein product [Urochloa humidicola]